MLVSEWVSQLALADLTDITDIWPNMPIWAYGHMGICEKNMAKWGIPEKSIKNVAQGC